MARSIDADSLKKKKTVLWDEALGFCDCVLVEDIDNEPTVNNMIQCGECQHANNDTWPVGKVWCQTLCRYMEETGFCSYVRNEVQVMNELKNWKEVTRGLFRYVIAANACYEIHILYQAEGTNILTAKASLFVVGDWYNNSEHFFDRECLLAEQPVFECLAAARKDFEECCG